MNKTITAQPINSELNKMLVQIPLPNQCPLCSVGYMNEPHESYYILHSHTDGKSISTVYSFYFCPYCERFFLAQYHVESFLFNTKHTVVLDSLSPHSSTKTAFTDQIKAMSPDFVEIYHQAEEAESHGLLLICGMAYRKALEFLIKDYAITFNSDECETIQKLPLSK